MRQFLESFATAFLILFSIPSVLVVASWNSLPGEPMFSVKLGLEQALAFVVAPSYSASTQLAFQYTERRFTDARTLLSEKHSVTGLVYLAQQVEQTQKTIEKTSDAKAQAEAAKTYIASLEDVSNQLEVQKRMILVQGADTAPQPQTGGQNDQSGVPKQQAEETALPTATPIPPPAGRSTPTPTPTPTPAATAPPFSGNVSAPFRQNTPTSTPTPTPVATPPPSVATTQAVAPAAAVVALQITQTQEEIKKTIRELKKNVKASGDGKERKRPDEKNKGDEKERNRRENREREKDGRNPDLVP